MVLSGSSGRSSGQLQNESGSQPHDQSRSQTLKTVLVLGATGATGQHVVRQLIQRGCLVKAVVRDVTRLPMDLQESESLEVVVGSIHTMTPDQLKVCVAGCDDVVSCLGHRLSVAGILGPPWRLVKRSLKSVCEVMQQTHPFDTHASIDLKSTLHRQTYVEGEHRCGVDTGVNVAGGVADRRWMMLEFVEMLEKEERILGNRFTDICPHKKSQHTLRVCWLYLSVGALSASPHEAGEGHQGLHKHSIR